MKNRERGRRKKTKEKTRSWAGFGPAHAFGPGLAHFKKKIKEKKYFSIFIISPCVLFYAVLFNLSLFFFISKKYEFGIKIPGFRQNFQKYKKKIKKRKIFLCIRPNVSKLKNYIVFFIH